MKNVLGHLFFNKSLADRPLPALLIGIVCCATACRLFGINQPFMDTNSWREADTAMIAENFYRAGYDIAHPRVNWSANTTGIVGTEFPALPFIAAVAYQLWGVQDWIGRLIPVVIFIWSIPSFFLLADRIIGSRAALWAVTFYAFTPLGIVVSRSFMPDAVALAFSVIGLYQFLRSTESGRFRDLAFSAIVLSGAILVKAPYAVVLAPVAYIAFRTYGVQYVKSWQFWFLGSVVLLPSIFWYIHALRIPTAVFFLDSTRGHFFGERGIGIVTPKHILNILKRSWWPYFTPLPIVLGLAGFLLTGSSSRFGALFHWWLLAMTLFVIADGPGNDSHHWYQLPFIPVCAAFSGKALDRVFERFQVPRTALTLIATTASLTLILCLMSYVGLRNDYILRNTACVEAARELNISAPLSALVLVTDEGDPSCLYYAHRKGWHWWNPGNDRDAIESLERYRAAGATYLLIDEYHLWLFDYYQGFSSYLNNTYAVRTVPNQFFIASLAASKRVR